MRRRGEPGPGVGRCGTLAAVARPIVLGIALLSSLPALARAEERPAAPPRPLYGRLAAGVVGALTGDARWAPAAELEVLPGDALGAGRLGARLAWRGDEDDVDTGWVVGGVAFEAAAARPRLQATLGVELGLAYEPAGVRAPVGGVVVGFHLWIFGPLSLSATSSAHVIVDGLDTELILAGGLALGVGNAVGGPTASER